MHLGSRFLFEFSTVGKVLFGVGMIERLATVMRPLGRRILVVAGADRNRSSYIQSAIEAVDGELAWHSVCREPTLEDVELGLRIARKHRVEVVLGIGGGSAIDTAKAVAAVATNSGELLDYLEVVGLGKPLQQPGLPCVAVPTTAGTGAEVTRNSVIDVPERSLKVSLRHDYLLPKVALLDPRLTVTVPPNVTAATGFDALAQVIEPFVSNRANPMTDALARAGIKLAAKSLGTAYKDGNDLDARSDMAQVSLWGGMCLANARLGAVHGLAGPIGGMFHAPHGAVCAALLGPVMRANVAVAQRQRVSSACLERYTEIARMVTGDLSASIEDGIGHIERLAHELGIRGLGQLGVAQEQLDDIVGPALCASSMQGNPVALEAGEVRAILASAF